MSNELENLLNEGKLIELCEKTQKNNGFNEYQVIKWVTNVLCSSSKPEQLELLKASCLLGIVLSRKKVTATQLRRLLNGVQLPYEEMKNYESNSEEIQKKIVRLKMNIAYTAARNSDLVQLTTILDAMLGKVKTIKDLTDTITLMEGVVAYHKLAGGRDQ